MSPHADIDALQLAYTAASQVQERAQKIKKEINRVRIAQSHRKDSLDPKYFEPVHVANFQDRIVLGPRGLTINPDNMIYDQKVFVTERKLPEPQMMTKVQLKT